jgi:5-methylcytosine-specific restriction endonuclease McrA
MDRRLYPTSWSRIARAVKRRADWKCQECGKPCRRAGEPLDTHRRTLTVHHSDGNPGNCAPDNLIALRAPCHLRIEGNKMRAAMKAARKEREPCLGLPEHGIDNT